MKIDKKTIIIIAVAALGVGIFLFLPFPSAVKKPPAIPLLDKNELKELIAAENQTTAGAATESWGQRNPFVVTAANRLKGIDLAGIFWGSDKPSAIINNTVVKAGDQINDIHVKDIQNDKVIIVDARGRQKIISLKESSLEPRLLQDEQSLPVRELGSEHDGPDHPAP